MLPALTSIHTIRPSGCSNVQLGRGPGCAAGQDARDLSRSFDVRQLRDCTLKCRRCVGGEPTLAARQRPRNGIRESPDDQAFDRVRSAQLAGPEHRLSVPVHKIDELVGAILDLPLGEWREFDRLDTADEGVGHIGCCEPATGTGDEKTAGAAIAIDKQLEGTEEPRLEPGRFSKGLIVKGQVVRRSRERQTTRTGRRTDLTRSTERDHRCVGQRSAYALGDIPFQYGIAGNDAADSSVATRCAQRTI